MDFISPLLSFLTGIGGSIVTSIVSYKNKKLELESLKEKNKYRLEELKLERQLMLEEAKINLHKSQVETEGKVELKFVDAYKNTINEKDLTKSRWIDVLLKGSLLNRLLGYLFVSLFVFVDFLKHLIRPSVTIYVVIWASWIGWQSYLIFKSVGSGITVSMAYNIFYIVIYSVFQILFVILGWWFCDRRIAKNVGNFIKSKLN